MSRVWLTVLAVVAAPLFEEFIFRGILYRGFRRSFTAPLSALLSAGVFEVLTTAAAQRGWPLDFGFHDLGVYINRTA